MKIKSIKKVIRNTYGKKGLKFTKDVCGNIMTPQIMFRIFKYLKGGFQEQKERILREKELEAIKNCREQFKETTEVVGMFTYGCLVIEGVIDLESERRKEIETNVYPEINKIQEEIDSGEFDFVFVDDEDRLYKFFDMTITNRLIVASKITAEEHDVFVSCRNKLTSCSSESKIKE